MTRNTKTITTNGITYTVTDDFLGRNIHSGHRIIELGRMGRRGKLLAARWIAHVDDNGTIHNLRAWH